MSNDPFRDQLAVITGGAGGLGAAMARAFAARGARLVLTDISAEGLAERVAELGQAVVATEVVDVADREAMQAFAEGVLERFGPPRILVNNAGVAVSARSIDTTLDDWDWLTGINILGVCYGIRLFGPAMEAADGRSHIVNVASAAGLTGAPAMPAYSMTKCAVVGLSEAMRFEFDADRLMTHVVCPGFVETQINVSVRAADPVDRKMGEKVMKRATKQGRTPADVADAVVRALDKRAFWVFMYAEAQMARLMRHLPDFARVFAWRRVQKQSAEARARIAAKLNAGRGD